MPPLSLRIEPKPRETLHSFVARLASLNGMQTGDFLHDFNLPKTKLTRLDPTTLVGAITKLADLDSTQTSDLMSWTGEPGKGGPHVVSGRADRIEGYSHSRSSGLCSLPPR